MIDSPPAHPHKCPGAPLADTQFTAGIVGLMPLLRKLARRLYQRDDEAAADLVQEALVKAWQARGSFAAGTNLKAWLFTIMRNQFRSEVRRGWRQMPWDEEAAERLSAPPAEQLWTVELDDAVRAIDSLSVRRREALILSVIGGLSSKDAAVILHCPPNAAKNRVHRARHAVSAMLEGKEPIKLKRNGAKGCDIADLVGQVNQLTAHHARRVPAHAVAAA
ncbi:MAG TPA: RNA polymerase sigma factor [Rhizomicrobium sp.]|jgi:RNA polymerase sigma-70 factor (ECF subfamily)|nr:RNA polymerase sigma factor [Rhizomicrobium sp.]